MRDQIKTDIEEYKDNDNGKVSPPVLWDARKAVLQGKGGLGKKRFNQLQS